MRIIIIEDENRAAHRLQTLIKELRQEAEIVKVFESVRESIEYFSTNPYVDLIFADIQLADGISFEIFNQIQIKCPIIFTTAYDQYAIEAFQTNGIDYLLKPIEKERLLKALDKLDSLQADQNSEQIGKMLQMIKQEDHKKRFMIKVGDRIRTIETKGILAFYSMEKATFLYTFDQRSYAIDYSLDQLQELLSPSDFFRISRKYIVSHMACKEILAWSNSRLRIDIPGLNEEVIVARERVGDFKNWLDN